MKDNIAFDFTCPHCGKVFKAHNLDSCPHCGKEISEYHYALYEVRKMFIGDYSCCLGLFPNEEEFLSWTSKDLKRVVSNKFFINGFTYTYDDYYQIIDVSFDFNSGYNPEFLYDLLEGQADFDCGLMYLDSYSKYLTMWKALKNVKSNDEVYLVKHRDVEYYVIYDKKEPSPFFDLFLKAIPKDKVPAGSLSKDIKELILKDGDLLWDDNEFYSLDFSELNFTMLFFNKKGYRVDDEEIKRYKEVYGEELETKHSYKVANYHIMENKQEKTYVLDLIDDLNITLTKEKSGPINLIYSNQDRTIQLLEVEPNNFVLKVTKDGETTSYKLQLDKENTK